MLALILAVAILANTVFGLSLILNAAYPIPGSTKEESNETTPRPLARSVRTRSRNARPCSDAPHDTLVGGGCPVDTAAFEPAESSAIDVRS